MTEQNIDTTDVFQNEDVFDDNFLEPSEADNVTEEIVEDAVKAEDQQQRAEESKSNQESEESDSEDNNEVDNNKGDISNEEKKDETPLSNDESWTKELALDERRKRQELEQELQKLQKQLSDANTPPQEEIKRPDVLDDPDGAFQHTENKIEQQLYDAKLALSRDMMKQLHEDYDQVEKEFDNMMAKDPSLGVKVFKSANPAKFAYETAQNHLNAQKFSDPDYEKKLEDRIREKILAEMNSSSNDSKDVSKPQIQVPKSFAGKANQVSDNPRIEILDTNDLFKDSPF